MIQSLAQTAEQFIGLVVTCYVIHIKLEGHRCETLSTTLYAALILYSINFVLYFYHHIDTYHIKNNNIVQNNDREGQKKIQFMKINNS